MTGRVLAALWMVAQAQPSFRSDVELVTVPCKVLDAEGRAVTDVAREEFRVFDNGTRRIIQSVWMENDQPLTLGVIVDVSESQADQVAEHRAAALGLLDRVMRPGDRAFVVAVGQDVKLWADTATTVAEIRRQTALDPAEVLGAPCARRASGLSECGGSPLWNAVYETARLKLRPAAGDRALVILTDGFDTGSTHTWRQAADEVARAGAAVYAIQYPSSLGGRFAPDLNRLLEESGGAWFGPPAGDYAAIVARIESDQRSRYMLSFKPDTTRGKGRHEVRVEVLRPDLKLRYRTAYVVE